MDTMKNAIRLVAVAIGLALSGGFFWTQMQELGFFEKEEVEPEKGPSATIMVYMIGSDLESDGGCATADIEEMCDAALGDSVNVIIQTGGADKWEYSKIDKERVQRFSVQRGELRLEQNLDKLNMVESETLSDFLKWGKETYPADRYGVIFWNHGGGTMLGFGADEYYPGEYLGLDRFAQAMKDAEISLDFVGFDACMMGTIEMAYLMEPYADYLIASEDVEPGSGWYYTNWLSELAKDPLMDTEKLGKMIVDEFVNSPNSAFWEDKTLSLIKLDEIADVYEQLGVYLTDVKKSLEKNGFLQEAHVRCDSKEFGGGNYDQIDILDYANRSSGDEEPLIQALEEAVVYCEGNVADCCGLAMYYPYAYPDEYSNMQKVMEDIGFLHEGYESCFSTYLELLKKEKEKNTLKDEALKVVEKNGIYVLNLTPQQWENIIYAERQLYIDDGTKITNLGYDIEDVDNMQMDLMFNADATWLAINGELVTYYADEEGNKEDGTWYRCGYVPATLTTGEEEEPKYIEIAIYWDEEHPEGYVTGYRRAYEEEEGLSLPTRNMIQFQEGDKINMIYNYCAYVETLDVGHEFGETIVYGEDELEVSYQPIGEKHAHVEYFLEDIYQNGYWTDAIELK